MRHCARPGLRPHRPAQIKELLDLRLCLYGAENEPAKGEVHQALQAQPHDTALMNPEDDPMVAPCGAPFVALTLGSLSAAQPGV
jgi:hypothetical protein